jgi:cytidylate kinase
MARNSSQKPRIVAVDGPAGSGKSSICAQVARELGLTYVNTGAIYRALGYVIAQKGISTTREEAVLGYVDELVAQLTWDAVLGHIWYGSEDLTSKLGSVEVGNYASLVAKMPNVRNKLLDVQRRWALLAPKAAIVDGRDIGTVIFPDADLKIYMTASLEERARRRLQQLGDDPQISLNDLMEDIAARDRQDSSRGAAPMKKADAAVELDTTGLDVKGVVKRFAELLREHEVI